MSSTHEKENQPRTEPGIAVRREITIPCDSQYLADLRAELMRTLGERGLGARDIRLLTLAVDEAVTSILHHARETHRRGDIRVVVDLDDCRFQALVMDQTNHTSTEHLSEEELDAHLTREREHRLGIFIMRAIMDEVTYSYKRGFQNELLLVRFL
ncbi:MAG: ATP-binding protein [Planctomycetes bacterium]|nr:ATP-binding protein [Planctomycetota bacterium]